MFIRSHVSRPVSNWTSLYTTKILTLLNYKMGESVLAVNEVDCSSKKVKKISHTRWSKHWAEGALVGGAGEEAVKDMTTDQILVYCSKANK